MEPPSHYVFIASAPDDPNAPQEEKIKEPEPEVEKPSEKPQVSAVRSLYVLQRYMLATETGKGGRDARILTNKRQNQNQLYLVHAIFTVP